MAAQKVLYITREDTLPLVTCSIVDADGAAVAIPEDATVTFRMRDTRGGTPKVSAAATVVSAEAGTVSYQFVDGDTDTLGDYYVEWYLSGFGNTETFPKSTYNVIVVKPSLLDTLEDQVDSPIIVTGPQGPQGEQGIQGETGPAGADGADINDIPRYYGYTTADIDLYVATTGNDSNPGTAGSPLLTIQAALALIPRKIYHKVRIHIGAGNFAGAWIDGFETNPPLVSSNYSYFDIQGTMGLVTPATGANTGTVTSVTTISGASFATITDSGQAWTTNDLRGKYIEILTGTGSTATEATPCYHLIESNTSTSLTVLNSGVTMPAASSTYRIITPSTFITSGVVSAAASGAPNGTVAFASTAAGLAFVNCRGSGFSVSRVEFTQGSSMPRGLGTGDNRLRVMHCRFAGSSGTTFGLFPASANMINIAPVLFECVFSYPSATGTMLNYASLTGGMSTSPSVTSCLFINGSVAYSAAGSATGPAFANCSFRGASIAMSVSSLGATQINNCRFDSCGYAIRSVESSSSGLGTVSFGLLGVDISNSTTAGVSLQGAFTSVFLSNTSGSSNAIGLQISRGAKAVVASNTTLTGTTEVSIDGTSSDLATMRAASPKIVSNANYLTAFYE